MSEKFRVNELVRFDYSDIEEYIDENHTDRPLRNDILVKLLNKQDESINELKHSNYSHAKTIIQLTDKINQLGEENEQLKRKKERYKQLSEIRDETINNIILSIKEFTDNCEDEKVKNILKDLLYSEVKEYDLAKENRKLKREVKRLKCINEQLEDRLDRDIALNMDCGDVE